MTDEQSVTELAPVEVQEPVVNEADKPIELEVEAEVSDVDPEAEVVAPPDDDEEEIEFKGEKYKVPKTLKEAFLMQEDYTRKTQEVAEERKAFEYQQQQHQEQVEFLQENWQDYSTLGQIESKLAQINQIDMNQMIDQDPVEALKVNNMRTQLIEAHQQLTGKIQQSQQQFALNQQQATAKQIEQSVKVLATELKDWSPDTGKQVREYLKSQEKLGITDEDIKAIDQGKYGPLPIIWARKAQLYDQLQKQAVKKPESAPPPPPVTKVGSKATVTKSPAQMSDAEFARWRKNQIAQRHNH